MKSEHPLLKQIQKGEGKTLEFKRELPKGQQLAQTIIAFANTSGGKLVVGVDDDRTLVGLKGADIFDLQDSIASQIFDLCRPNLLPNIYVENINNVELLVIEVSRGRMVPYSLKNKERDKGTYIRLGATNRLASPEYIADLERQRFNITFDEEIDYQTDFSTLDLSPLEERFAKHGKILDQ